MLLLIKAIFDNKNVKQMLKFFSKELHFSKLYSSNKSLCSKEEQVYIDW